MHGFSQQNQIDFVNQVMTFVARKPIAKEVAQEFSQIWRIQINLVLHGLMCSTAKPWQASCRSGLRDLLHRANTLPCAAGMEQKTIITTLTRKPILMSFRRSDRNPGLPKCSQCVTSVETDFMLWSFKESGSSLHFETSCTTEHGANLHPQAQLVASSVTRAVVYHVTDKSSWSDTRFGAPTTTVTAFFTWTTTVAAWSGFTKSSVIWVAFVVKNQMCLKFFQFDEICHGRSRSLLHYPGLVKPQRPNFSAETHLQKWLEHTGTVLARWHRFL